MAGVADCGIGGYPSLTPRRSRVVEEARAQLHVQFFSPTEHLVMCSGDETVGEFGEFLIRTCFSTESTRVRGDAPRLLRRHRPPRFAARSIPLGRPARLMVALWDGTDLSWPEERGARPTVVTVVDNAGRRSVLSR